MTIPVTAPASNATPRFGPHAGRQNVRQPASPGRLAITRAVPPGSRRPRGQVPWSRTLAEDPELARLRPVRQANILAVAKVLCAYASWRDMTTRPTRARVCERAGITLGTWKNCRRWLEAHGYLGTVSPGRAAGMSRNQAAVLAPTCNEAAVYVLTVPRRRQRTPCLARVSGPACPPTQQTKFACTGSPREMREKTGIPRELAPPGSPLRSLTPGWFAHLTGRFTGKGWTARDLAHAIDYTPAGAQHRYPLRDVRHPAGWLRWRLSHWLGPDGLPGPSRSQMLAATAASQAAAQARRRAEEEAAGAARAEPTMEYQRIRALLGEQRRGWQPGTVQTITTTREDTPR